MKSAATRNIYIHPNTSTLSSSRRSPRPPSSPRSSPLTPPPPLLLKTPKLPLRPLAQLLQNRTHSRQLALQLRAGLIIRALVEREVDLALRLARFVGGVVVERLGEELDVERRLHEGWEGIFCRGRGRGLAAGFEGLDEEETCLL